MEQCAWGNARTAIVRGSVDVQQRTAIMAAMLVAAMLVLGLADAGLANAQSIYIGPRVYGPGSYGPGPYDPGPRAYDPALPPYEIMRIVRSSGMAPLTRPVRRGAYYVVLAGTRSGGQMRVLVDAYGGEIVKVNPMVAMDPYGSRFAAPYGTQPPVDPYGPAPRLAPPYDAPPRIAGVPPEIKDPPPGSIPPSARHDEETPPLPPRTVPNGRLAAAPYAATPPRAAPPVARTPMPRPRPSVAARETPAVPPATTPQSVEPSSPVAADPPAAVVPPPAVTSPPATEPTTMVPVAPLE